LWRENSGKRCCYCRLLTIRAIHGRRDNTIARDKRRLDGWDRRTFLFTTMAHAPIVSRTKGSFVSALVATISTSIIV
jgi:hypothetical protein